MESKRPATEAALEELQRDGNLSPYRVDRQRPSLLEVLAVTMCQGGSFGALWRRLLRDNGLRSQVLDEASQDLRPHLPHTRLSPFLPPELRDDALVESTDAQTATLEPPAEASNQVAVAAHGLPRVPMLLRHRSVRVEVRAEEPGAMAAQDLRPREVVVQHGFSFGRRQCRPEKSPRLCRVRKGFGIARCSPGHACRRPHRHYSAVGIMP
jgi:hypothetical protein